MVGLGVACSGTPRSGRPAADQPTVVGISNWTLALRRIRANEDPTPALEAAMSAGELDASRLAGVAEWMAHRTDAVRSLRWMEAAIDHGYGNGRALAENPVFAIWSPAQREGLAARMRTSCDRRFAAQRRNSLPLITADAAGLDPSLVEVLVLEARRTGSTTTAIATPGHLLAEWQFDGWDRPVELMSATKTFGALAIGLLIKDGRIRSLDTPIASFFPERAEWLTGERSRITIRHVLTHTTGLRAARDSSDVEAAEDTVATALAAESVDPPGGTYFYNNLAVSLIAGIVERVAGAGLDDFIKRRLFEPLGIRDTQWARDPSGHAYVHYGLQIRAGDLARLGLLMLDDGRWNGAQLLPHGWSTEMATPRMPSGTYGLLTWVDYGRTERQIPAGTLATIRLRADFPDALSQQISPLEGTYFATEHLREELLTRVGAAGKAAFYAALGRSRIELAERGVGPAIGYSAKGSWGNYLVVCPETHVVVVRLVERSYVRDQNELGFWAFAERACSLGPRSRAPAAR